MGHQQDMPRSRRRRPSHPGALLREDVLPALNLTRADFARILGVAQSTIDPVLDEKAPITTDLAMRVGKLCGDGAGIWLRMQQALDIWLVERELKDQLASIPTMRAAEPAE